MEAVHMFGGPKMDELQKSPQAFVVDSNGILEVF